MPDVGTGTVVILPDFSRFGKEVERGLTPHINAAGKDMEQTFAASAKKSAASVDAAFAKTKGGIDVPITANTRAFVTEMDREVDRVANKATADLKDLPVSADAGKLDRSVVDAARKAAKKAADELSRIPGGVDEARFRSEVASAAQKAANEATTRLANIPAGINASSLQAEVAAAAAKAARPIEIDVNADTSDFRKIPAEIRPHVKKAGDDIESTFASSAKGAGKAIAGAIGVGLAIGFGQELLELGNQTAVFQQKTKTVFEDSTKDVLKWAKENNRALGLTESRLAGLAANFGDLLKPMGFTSKEAADLSTKALDLAGALSAWSGGTQTVADVSATLSKALLGEREELKGLGIAISEADVSTRLLEKGQSALVGTALAQAKAIATQELIFEKSTDAQKAWADGSFDAIKKQNELRAKVSELVEVVATGLLPVFTAAADVLTAIPGPAISAAAAIAGIAVAGLGIHKVVTTVSDLSARLADATVAGRSLNGVMGLVGKGAALGAGIGVAAVTIDVLTDALQRYQHGPAPKLPEMGNALVRFGESGKAAGVLAREFGTDFSKLGDKLKDLEGGTGSGGILGNIFSPNTRSRIKDAKTDIDTLDKSLAALVQRGETETASTILEDLARQAGVTVPEVTKHLDDYRGALAEVDTEQILTGKSAKKMDDATGDLAPTIEEAQRAMARYGDTIRDAYKASMDLVGSQLSAAEAVNSLRDSAADTAGKERELAEAIRVHGRASGEAKAAGEALEDSRRRQLGDVDALAQANVRLAEQQALAAGKTLSDRDKYALYRDELIKVKDTLAPEAPLRQHLQGLIDQLPPPVIKSQVVLDTAKFEASLRQIQAAQKTFGVSLPFVGQIGDRKHDGGFIKGAKDEVPILAQRGEFMLQKSAATAIGGPTLEALNRFHTGGMVGGPKVLERMATVAEPVTATQAGSRVEVGGIVLNGVPDGESALTRLPQRLASSLYLAGV